MLIICFHRKFTMYSVLFILQIYNVYHIIYIHKYNNINIIINLNLCKKNNKSKHLFKIFFCRHRFVGYLSLKFSNNFSCLSLYFSFTF